MAEEQTPNSEAAATGAAQGPQFVLQKLYVKDVSFEVPNAPAIFKENAEAEMKLNLSQRVQELEDDMMEVVLTVTVTAETSDSTAYLAEVHQAGIFLVRGFEEQQKQAVLNTLCPHTLYPYARRIVTDLVLEGGFPPINLQPINWDQMYAQRLQQSQQQAADTSADELDLGSLNVEGEA